MPRILLLACGLAFAAGTLAQDAATATESPAAPAAAPEPAAPPAKASIMRKKKSPRAEASGKDGPRSAAGTPGKAAAKKSPIAAAPARTGKKPAAAAAPAPRLPAMTAEQIVKRNVAARGGRGAWHAVDTLTLSGKMDAGGNPNVELPFVMKMKRGHKSRLELTFRDQTAVQVYDGTRGWKVRPFLNRDEVEPYTPAEAKAAAEFEELDGPLIDHAKKGTSVKLLGTERVEGKGAYKLKLTAKSGTQRTIWIDGRSFLELKLEGEPKKIDGKVRTVSVYFRDYKTERGLTTPRVLETVYEGTKVSRKMKITRVTVNEPIQDAIFQKPQVAVAGPPPGAEGRR